MKYFLIFFLLLGSFANAQIEISSDTTTRPSKTSTVRPIVKDNALYLVPRTGTTIKVPITLTSITQFTTVTTPSVVYDGSVWNRVSGTTSTTTAGYNSVISASVNGFYYQRIIDGGINVKWFGAKVDGSTNDATALTNAINYLFTSNGGIINIIGSMKLSTPLVISPPAGNWVAPITIQGGGTIDLTGMPAASTAFTFQVGASTIWRNLTIKNLFFNGGVDVLKFDGGPGGKYMYHFVVKDIEINGASGTTLWLKGNFFESQYQNINFGTSSTTKPCILLDASDLSGGGALGSIDFIACNASGGTNNVGSVGPITDINFYGGTFLSSQNESIFLGAGASGFCYKSSIIGSHIETGWRSATSLATGGAAVRIVGSGTVQDVIVYSNSALGSYMKYVAQYYLSGYGNGVINNCQISGITGQKIANLAGTAGKSVTIIGNDLSYDWDYSPIIINEFGTKGLVSPAIRQTNNAVGYGLTITPDLRFGHNISVGTLTGNMTINNVVSIEAGFTPGHKLVYVLTQDGTGGRTVTWGTDYVIASGSVNTAANTTSVIELTQANGKWRQVSVPAGTVDQTKNVQGFSALSRAGYVSSAANADLENPSGFYTVNGTPAGLPTDPGGANIYYVERNRYENGSGTGDFWSGEVWTRLTDGAKWERWRSNSLAAWQAFKRINTNRWFPVNESMVPIQGELFSYNGTEWKNTKPIFINVKDFGAVGNNVAVDGPAVQNAINYARTNNYSEVHFPKGIYKCNTKITTYRDIRLVGFGATLQFAGLTGSTVALEVAYANGINEKVIVGLSIEGVVSAAQYPAVNEWKAATTGILFTCPILNLENVGIFGFDKGTDFGSDAYIISFIDCQIQKNNVGVFFDATINSRTNLGENMLFRGGIIGNNRTGISNKLGMFHFLGTSIDYNKVHIGENVTKISGTSSAHMILDGCHIENSENGANIIVNNGSMQIVNSRLWYNDTKNMILNNDELILGANMYRVPSTLAYLVSGNCPSLFNAGAGVTGADITYIHPDLSNVGNGDFEIALDNTWLVNSGTGTGVISTTKKNAGTSSYKQTGTASISTISYSPFIRPTGRNAYLSYWVNNVGNNQGNFGGISEYDALGNFIKDNDDFMGVNGTDVFVKKIKLLKLNQNTQLIKIKLTGCNNSRDVYWDDFYLAFK